MPVCAHTCVFTGQPVTEVCTEGLLTLVTEAGRESLNRVNLGPLGISPACPQRVPSGIEVQVSGATSWWAEARPMLFEWAVLGFPPGWGGETPTGDPAPSTLHTPGSQPSAVPAPPIGHPPTPAGLWGKAA